eukprot:7255993-Pyramimonas_sp.AAC.1
MKFHEAPNFDNPGPLAGWGGVGPRAEIFWHIMFASGSGPGDGRASDIRKTLERTCFGRCPWGRPKHVRSDVLRIS